MINDDNDKSRKQGNKLPTADDIQESLFNQFAREYANGEGKFPEFLDEYFFGNAWDYAEVGGDVAAAPPDGGGSRPACRQTAYPPNTNRGGEKYRIENNPDTGNSDFVPQYGGYDGGMEVGFEGYWDKEKFLALLADLETAKQAASELSEWTITDIGGMDAMVSYQGANCGMHYKYVFAIYGVMFFVHHNCPQNRQAVRIRYGATSLIGIRLFSVHAAVRALLASLGFTVTKEVISRVDMQVMVHRDVSEFVNPILGNHSVCSSAKDNIYRNHRRIESYTVGSKNRVQLCIYDKRAEMDKMWVSDPEKWKLMINCSLGEAFLIDGLPLTRIEFRLGRDALKHLGIDTIADLEEKESSLAEWLPRHWFRLLEKPAVRGHENTAAVHSLWLEVQAAFRQWFPGVQEGNKEVKWNYKKPVSCDAMPLLKQGAGCIAKAVALRYGVQKTVSDTMGRVMSLLRALGDTMFEKVNDTSQRVRIMRGVILGKEMEDNKRVSFEEWFVPKLVLQRE